MQKEEGNESQAARSGELSEAWCKPTAWQRDDSQPVDTISQIAISAGLPPLPGSLFPALNFGRRRKEK